jgi:alanyl aminopeptidase
MSADSLLAARRIREPIVTDGDIDGAFDAITYAKGQAVLEMFEAWIGPAAFQAGVRRYLARHAGGTATTADFLAALSEAASASDVALVRDALGAGAIDLRAAFSSFLDQAGVPMVSARLTCDPGPARLRLAQARYLPDGVRVSGHERWQIPICVRWGGTSAPGTGADPDARDGSARVCYLLDRPVAELPLSRAPSREASCPEWVQVNAGMAGYYRVRYEGDLLGRLLADGGTHLAPAERLGLLGDLAALVSSGALPAGHILEHVPALVGAGRERHLTSLAIDLVAGLRAELVPPELVAGYERFVGRTFGARARELGWKARGEDDDDTRLLRPQLVAFVADRGGDVALRAEAQRLATLWLDDPRVVEPDVVGALLATAAAHGDATLWQRLHDRLAGERQLRERTRLLLALAAFRSPALLAKNHALVLSPALEPSEAFALLMRSGGANETHVATYELVKRHYDALVARSPRRGAVGDEGLRLASVAAGLCDPAARADAAAFFGARTRKLSGGDRALDQILERIDQCIARKRRQAASVREFLARQ